MRGGVCRWWREFKYRDQGRMELRDRLWAGLGREEVPAHVINKTESTLAPQSLQGREEVCVNGAGHSCPRPGHRNLLCPDLKPLML